MTDKCPKCGGKTYLQEIMDGEPIICCNECTWNELYQIEPIQSGQNDDQERTR